MIYTIQEAVRALCPYADEEIKAITYFANLYDVNIDEAYKLALLEENDNSPPKANLILAIILDLAVANLVKYLKAGLIKIEEEEENFDAIVIAATKSKVQATIDYLEENCLDCGYGDGMNSCYTNSFLEENKELLLTENKIGYILDRL